MNGQHDGSTPTPPTEPEVADASDAVDIADEIAARFRIMQTHEEAAFVNRANYDDNVTELRTLLAALQAYVVAPPIGVHGW